MRKSILSALAIMLMVTFVAAQDTTPQPTPQPTPITKRTRVRPTPNPTPEQNNGQPNNQAPNESANDQAPPPANRPINKPPIRDPKALNNRQPNAQNPKAPNSTSKTRNPNSKLKERKFKTNKVDNTTPLNVVPADSVKVDPVLPNDTPTKPVVLEAPKKYSNPALELVLAQPTDFVATQTYTQDGYENTLRFAQKAGHQRVETEQNGIKIVAIALPEKQKHFIIRPDVQAYSEETGNSAFSARLDPFNLAETREQQPRNVKIENLGAESVGGYACEKFRISFDQANTVKKITVWKATALQGLIVKQELEFLNFHSIMELRDINLNVGDELFQLPASFKKAANTQTMFRSAPPEKK